MNSSGCSFFASLLTAFLLTGCIAGKEIKTAPDPGEPVAYAPKMCLGDKWEEDGYSTEIGKDKYYGEVTKVMSDGTFDVTWTSESKRENSISTRNQKLELIKSFDFKKNLENPVSHPPQQRLSFPLFVGKTWRDSYTGGSIDGNKYRYENTYKVTDYQKLKVKAGEFDVFRIWRIHKNKNRATNRSAKEIYYYSPQTKSIIYSKPSWRVGYELINYSVSNCD